MTNTPAVFDEVKPLSAAEQKRKEQLEGIVIRGARTFIEVGHALTEIRDRELYREAFPTFKLYAKHVFDIAESRAYQLMDAALVIDQVKNSTNCGVGDGNIIDMLPLNEAQVRPLVKLKNNPGQLKAVWQAVVDNAPKGKVTAAHVNKVVKGYLGETTKAALRVGRERVCADDLLGAQFKEAFDALLLEIEAAKESGYKTTSRENVLKHLDGLRAVIAEDGALIEDHDRSGHQNANKLEKAGYRLFRMDETSMNIKERCGGGWPKHSGPFSTKTAMKAAFAEILQDDNHLVG